MGEKEEESSQEIVGNIGLQSRNILGYTHAAGGYLTGIRYRICHRARNDH